MFYWPSLRDLLLTFPQLGFDTVPADKPDFDLSAISPDDAETVEQGEVLQNLHKLLLATEVREGKMVCGNCGHEYNIKEGIANFLLPSHLGKYSISGALVWKKELMLKGER